MSQEVAYKCNNKEFDKFEKDSEIIQSYIRLRILFASLSAFNIYRSVLFERCMEL